MPQGRGSIAAARHLQTVGTFGRWDCINARQRETAKESRFAACASLLTSPATRRPPPKCGAFRLQPRGAPLRQTGCWREMDSNHRSPARKSRFCCGRRIAGTELGQPKRVVSYAVQMVRATTCVIRPVPLSAAAVRAPAVVHTRSNPWRCRSAPRFAGSCPS